MDEYRNKEGKKVVIVTILSNFILTSLNLFVGNIGGSYALIAEGHHTLSDIITTIIAYIGFKIGQKPSDEEHPGGHGRVEAICGLVIVLFLAVIGWNIMEEAIKKILNPNSITVPDHYVALMAVIGIFLNLIISTYVIRVGKKINSPSLVADGYHQRTDVFSSAAILIGVVIAKIGYPIFDPLVGVLIGILILKTAFSLAKENIDCILGKVPDKEIIREIENAVNETPNAYEPHNIIIDNYGPYITVNLHVRVDGNITVNEAHEIVHMAEQNILKIPIVNEVSVHACPLHQNHKH